jgi:phage terminase large subunit-like protein
VSQKPPRHERAAEKRRQLQEGLPYIYGHKYYRWQRDYMEARQRMQFITAANQVGKSTIQICKCLHWATAKNMWSELWPKITALGHKPNLFWYFYPDKSVAHVEWETKWKPLMPSGEFKDHPVYGWKEEYDDRGYIDSIAFRSGVSVYFKTYGQRVRALQTATVFAVFADEELPEEYYHELVVRTQAVRGFFSMVFTATLGQQLWARTMEGIGEAEKFPDAFKRQVALDDCRFFDDGTPGLYDDESIAEATQMCANEAEVQRRIKGRFVISEGLVYNQFRPAIHFVKPFPIPAHWHKYGTVDHGGGGPGGSLGHPPAITYIAVNEEYTKAYIYRGWKGDDGKNYTAQDSFDKFVTMRGSDALTLQRYDQACKDFFTIAQRQGENFLPAIKDTSEGEATVNTLFKNMMLFIFDDSEDDDPQLHKLATEFQTIRESVAKKNRSDDMADTVRYACVSIPFDFSCIKKGEGDVDHEAKPKEDPKKPLTDEEKAAERLRQRRGERGAKKGEDAEGWGELQEEIDEWNTAYG